MNLEQLRKEKNFTQSKVASMSNISTCFYSQIESGARKPSVETAKKIAIALGIDWTYFFETDLNNLKNKKTTKPR